MPLLDGRPPAVDARFRPGNTFTVTLNWPAGALTGRTFTAALDATALTVNIVGDDMTVSMTEAQTTAAAAAGDFVLTEVTGGISDVVLVGSWHSSNGPSASETTVVSVNESSGVVTVNVTAGASATQGIVKRWTQALSGLGAVCFVWDDGYLKHTEVAAINEARGQQVTFAITTGLIGTADHLPDAAAVLALHNQGHEIAAHGVQHTTGLPSLTAAQRAAEYDACMAWFPANGIPTPSTWVYTFGQAAGRSDTTDQELWLRVDRVLDTAGSFALGAAVRRDQFGFAMKRQQAEAVTAGSLDRAKSLIRMAAQQPVVVAFYMHNMDAGSGSLTTAQYTELCDLALTLGVPVVTARDALPPNQLLVDGGFEYPTIPGMWDTQVTGTSSVAVVADTPVVGLGGTQSVRLRTVDTGAFEFSAALQYVAVKPGVAYTLSGRYRTSVNALNNTARTRFTSYDHKGVILGTATTTNLNEATAWTRFTHAYTAHAEAAFAQIMLLNDPSSTATHDVYFDHVCLLPTAAGVFG